MQMRQMYLLLVISQGKVIFSIKAQNCSEFVTKVAELEESKLEI